MKVCGDCKATKPFDDFSPLKSGRDGRNPICKACRSRADREARLVKGDEMRAAERRRHHANKEIKKASRLKWYAKNKAIVAQRMVEYHKKNQARILAKKAEYRAANRDNIYVLNGARRAAEKQAMLPSCDRKAMSELYRLARKLTQETGIPHHVDHVVPLRHEEVCGLHVNWNMQVIPAADNMNKSNKWTG